MLNGEHRRRARGAWYKRLLGGFTAIALTLSTAAISTAEDTASLVDTLGTASDFRVRTSAALSLGRTHNRGAVGPLLGALDDSHPAVRAAAAAALAILAQKETLPSLRSHLARERSLSVRSQLQLAVQSFADKPVSRPAAATILVKLGQLKNVSGVRGAQLCDLFRGATRARAALLPGVEVLSEGSEAAREAVLRNLPLVELDGVVNRLAKGAAGERVGVSAQVEYVFSKMPEHAIRGSLTGAAFAEESSKAPRDDARVTDVEDRALRGAVESAMRGAPELMLQAMR